MTVCAKVRSGDLCHPVQRGDTAAPSSAALVAAVVCAGRHSCRSAAPASPASKLMVWALWNLACGGQVGLSMCVSFQSAR